MIMNMIMSVLKNIKVLFLGMRQDVSILHGVVLSMLNLLIDLSGLTAREDIVFLCSQKRDRSNRVRLAVEESLPVLLG